MVPKEGPLESTSYSCTDLDSIHTRNMVKKYHPVRFCARRRCPVQLSVILPIHGSHFSGLTKFPDFSSIFSHFSSIF